MIEANQNTLMAFMLANMANIYIQKVPDNLYNGNKKNQFKRASKLLESLSGGVDIEEQDGMQKVTEGTGVLLNISIDQMEKGRLPEFMEYIQKFDDTIVMPK